MTIIPGDLDDPRVCGLLEHHAKTARAATAPGSAHAVTLEGLKTPGITLWAAWDGDVLLGVGALRRLSNDHGEIKSMYTPWIVDAGALEVQCFCISLIQHVRWACPG